MARDCRVSTGVEDRIRGRAYDQIILHYRVRPWMVPEPQSSWRTITVGFVGSRAFGLVEALADLNAGKMVNVPGAVSGGQMITNINDQATQHGPCTDWNGMPLPDWMNCGSGPTATRIPVFDPNSNPDGWDPLHAGAIMLQYLFDNKARKEVLDLPPDERKGITIPPLAREMWHLTLIGDLKCEPVDAGMISEQIRFNLHETYEYEFRKRVYLVPTKWRTIEKVGTPAAHYYFDDPFFPLPPSLN